jgi:hypothetical protein
LGNWVIVPLFQPITQLPITQLRERKRFKSLLAYLPFPSAENDNANNHQGQGGGGAGNTPALTAAVVAAAGRGSAAVVV